MSTERPLSIEEHPDVVAMRLRYERAGARPVAQILDGMTFLTGLYAAVSPWVIGFNSRFPALTANNLIIGTALALLAIGFASAYERTHGIAWTAPLIGGWLIVSPYVIRADVSQMSTNVNNAVVGGVAVLLGLAAMSIGRTSSS